MKFNYLLALLIVLFTQKTALSQEGRIDSLSTKSYSELKDIFYAIVDKNDSIAKKVAYHTLKRATKDKNYEAVANSYIRLHYVFEDDFDLTEKYIDSSINICKTYKLDGLLAENYSNKGDLYYESGKYNSALKYYLKSRDYYRSIKDEQSYYILNYSVGLLKLRIQANEDALNIFKECLAYEEENTVEGDIVTYKHLNILRALAIAYAANDKIDSTTVINIKGYKLAKLHPEYNELSFTHIEGGNQFLKGNYRIAEDSIIKSLPLLKSLKSKGDLAIAYSHLGRIYVEYNELGKAMDYYRKVDSIYINDNYLIADPREIYEELINYYKNEEDFKQQLYYTEQLLKIDSILTKDYRVIDTTFKEYDVSNLITEKEKLTSLLNEEKNITNRNIIFLLGFISLLSLISISLYRKKVKNEKKFVTNQY